MTMNFQFVIYANLGPEAPVLTQDGFEFRDLNKNGKLDVYEDSKEPIDARVEDLLGQMTLEEKVGQMFSPQVEIGKKGTLQEKSSLLQSVGTSELIHEKKITTILCISSKNTVSFVEWHNKLQKLAERGTRDTRAGLLRSKEILLISFLKIKQS
ncbi:MAG: hypothetical protein ACTSQI_21150 [Candidatus Helarchaeota archaeon]